MDLLFVFVGVHFHCSSRLFRWSPAVILVTPKASAGGKGRGYQPGSLQLLASLNSDSIRSFPQSLLPARRGCF